MVSGSSASVGGRRHCVAIVQSRLPSRGSSRRRRRGFRSWCAALTCLLVATVAVPLSEASAGVVVPANFVSRNGAQLRLGGVPFRFTGVNIYNANSNGLCRYSMSGSSLGASLTAIGSGNRVIRSFFFQQLAITNGARDWTAFDRTFATAKAHGVKVIATLIDQWGNCGSMAAGGFKDASWYASGYKQRDPVGLVSYRDFVREIVTRYRDNPTILAWQLVNEPEAGDCSVVPEPTAHALLKSFAADVSGLVKAIDPHHLVSLGTIGTGQCGAQGADYKDVMSVPALDLCEYHDYQPHAMPGDQWNGLQVRLDQCNALHKPLIVGEVGIRPSDVGGTLAARAQVLAGKLATQFRAGVAGELAWDWNVHGSTLGDFDIGPHDPALSVLGHALPSLAAALPTVAAGSRRATLAWTPAAGHRSSPIRS